MNQLRRYILPFEFGDKTRISAWIAVGLGYMSIFGYFEVANDNRSLGAWGFLSGFSVLILLYAVISFIGQTGQSEKLYFWSGLGIRMFLVFLSPVFEDDWARYLWDGFQTSRFGSPYGPIPRDFFGDTEPVHAEILSRINHPDWPTIYGPVLEIYFFLIHFLFPWKLAALKFFLLIPDLFLFRWIRGKYGRNSGIMYWWNPVLLKETFLNGHPDIIGVSILFFAFSLAGSKRFRTAAFFSGLATAVKGFALIFLPLLLFESFRKRFGLSVFMGVVVSFSLGFLLPYTVFFLSSDGTDLGVVSRFANGFEFFPLGYILLRYMGEVIARSVWGLILLSGILILLKCRKSYKLRREEIMAASFFLFFFFSPVLNAWYLLWSLPFLFAGKRLFWPGWILFFLAQASYLNFANLGEWDLVLEKGYYAHPDWLVGLAGFGCVLPFLIWIWSRFFRRNSLRG
ncbi:hypothetical protein CH371_06875 [Leptospira wolffii]|uniref:DUF2029 domain-containing protein n=1 Tax=Leptospira wolffii TaxID=409998 RepID=A0A2M9ZHA7_9LEPT|nr:hypothetical protein [Leptospira wolffii]PJZ67716.1 hypothetical protein CH371_06875 [Leptospira wolffii]